jgi:(2Fe-2S) ferredoxin
MNTREWCEHHMNLSSTYLEMALRYLNINSDMHERYYNKHLEQGALVEKYKAMLVPQAEAQ